MKIETIQNFTILSDVKSPQSSINLALSKDNGGGDYTLLKTKKKVTGEFVIIFTCFNLRRSVSIFGIAELIKRLKAAFTFVNVLLRQILKDSKPSFQIIKNNHFTFSKN